MPIFEYVCVSCGHIFEDLILNREDAHHQKCPHCESTKVDLLPSAPGGYQINGNNSASVRPKGAGSFRRGK